MIRERGGRRRKRSVRWGDQEEAGRFKGAAGVEEGGSEVKEREEGESRED